MKSIDAFLESGSIISLGPEHVVVGHGGRNWQKWPMHDDLSHFYFPDYFLKEQKPWCSHVHIHEFAFEDLINQLTPFANQLNPKISWKNPYQNLFQDTFLDLQMRFSSKQLEKAVPFIFETAEISMSRSMIARSLISLLSYAKTYPLHLYGFWENGKGMLGATPEVLFSIKMNDKLKLDTMACAGTRSLRHGTPNSLLKDPKELREHQIVVDDMKEALSPFGIVKSDPLRITQLPGLAHLITPINVELQDEWSFDALVKALHPTPALGAYPRNAGGKWLSHYQTQIDRQRFGAPAGFFNRKTHVARCLVAIRNVQWNTTEMAIGAGCGVIPESNLEYEWEEIQTKLRAIKKMLSLSNE